MLKGPWSPDHLGLLGVGNYLWLRSMPSLECIADPNIYGIVE